jgi:hypothetical protein
VDSRSEARQFLAVKFERGIAPLFFICYYIHMDKGKLKVIVSDLEMLLSALKAEVYSDVESYRYDEIQPVELDYDEEFEGT